MTPETNYRAGVVGGLAPLIVVLGLFAIMRGTAGKWRGAKTASHDIHCSVGLDKSLGDEDRIEFDTPCTEL